MKPGAPPPLWKNGVASSTRLRQKLEQVAMKTIGAGFHGDIDDPAGGLAELRGEGRGLDLELLDAVDDRWITCAEFLSNPRIRFLLSTPSSR